MFTKPRITRQALMCGTAVAATLLLATPVYAQAVPDTATSGQATAQAAQLDPRPASASPIRTAPVEERQSYALRTMMQVHDGTEDKSHSQLLGVGRVRIGNRSLTQFDYGDGAAVIHKVEGKLAAGRFLNKTGVEKALVYNYDSQTIQGETAIAMFHNRVVRPLLGKGPPLSQNARWSATVPLDALGVAGLSGGEVTIELSREYFEFEGKPLVLVHYLIPAFAYDAEDGRTVVQWAQGISLTDPGFGQVFVNSALHRAVVRQDGVADRPYRYARSMVAANSDGSAMIDYRSVPQLQPYIEALFGKEAMRVVPPTKAVAETTDLPLTLAVNLDRIGLSIGENGANESGAAAAAQQDGDPTVGGIILEGVQKAATRVNQLGQAITITRTGAGLIGLPQFMTDVLALETATEQLARQMNIQNQKIAQAESILKSVPLVPEYSPKLVQLQQQQQALTRTMENANLVIEGVSRQIQELEAAGKAVPQNLRDELFEALEIRNRTFGRMKGVTAAMEEASQLPNAVKMVPDMSNPRAISALETIEELKSAKPLIESEAKSAGNLAVKILQNMKLSSDMVYQALEDFGNSKTAKFLDGLSHILNFVSVAQAGHNSYTAATTNIGAGDLPLTRNYGYDGWDAITALGLDLGGMAANALSGNLPGFWSDFTAITAGTFTDTVIAYKGIADVEKLNAQALKDGVELQKRLTANIERNMKEFDARWAGKPVLPNYTDEDPYEDGYSLPPWPQGEEPAAEPSSTDPNGQGGSTSKTTKPPVFAEPDPYPKADPVQPSERDEEPAPLPAVELTAEEQRIQLNREDNAQAAKDLLDYQDQLLSEGDSDESSLPGTYDFRVSTLETSELIASEFDIDPVRMDPVNFVIPTFDEDQDLFEIDENGNTVLKKVGPDDFVMTPYDPPEVSSFPPTDPDDLDGYPGTGEYDAFTYDSMSGTEPDISKWEELLATQDIKLLERLAIGAGYPSLAFALDDAENIIRKSLDQGYRAYASRSPNCAGYTGCMGSIGPWKMAWATVRLGDILAQSREIFSTGGFSDIGISGFNLMYLLRDHGIQDGDLIDVEISQFGRSIFELRDHFLLNEGSSFDVNLQPGVAQMVITALNEGSARPNTAEVHIDNVVRGEARQTYSLSTGQTAVLRIESNARPDN